MLNSSPTVTDSAQIADPFKDLPEHLRQMIWDRGVVTEYPTGSSIVSPGDPGDYFRFLVAGRARVLFRERDGQDIPVETLCCGDMVGEVSYLSGRPAPNNSEVIAQEPCRVLEIPASEFEKILKELPEVATLLLRNLARKVIRLDQSAYKMMRKKRALQNLISRQEHLFPDYFVSETVRRRTSGRLIELAHSDEPIIITGETGVGKEFMAHALYGMSTHYKRVFLCLDLLRPLPQTDAGAEYCLLPEEPADATDEQTRLFFGYETEQVGGPRIESPGYLELTEEGTLLVRGIEQLTTEMQEKLLATLRTGTYRRVGSETDQVTDFRLVGTTNLDRSEIDPARHPLLYWLLGNALDVPPLRRRRKEIPALVRHYVSQYCQELRKEINKLPNETMKSLVSYSWPGNDRELATTLKRAVLLASDGILRPQDIYFDLRRVEGGGKVDLLRLPALRNAVKSPLFPAIFQSMAAPFFFILLVLLFLGPADPIANVGGLFSWAVGWPTMVFGAFMWARFWCAICPMGTLSVLAKKIVSWDIPFPASLKQHSDWIIYASAMFIIWLETATDIRNSPFNTGLLLLSIVLLATIVSVIFERQSWCRYLCPLGGMMGVFAKVAPIELRADRNVCASQCTSNECYVGTKDHPGCPFGQMAPSLRSNRFCKVCGNCVKNCPHGAINLNLRVPGREIWEMRQVAAVTSLLVVSMLGGLLSEMFHKMSIYDAWAGWFLGLPQIVIFTIFFTVVVVASNALVAVASLISSGPSGETVSENLARYGLALLPLVLSAYMAYHLYYLINLGVYFPIVMWETFHFEIFRQLVITVPPEWTYFFQRLLVWAGLLGSLALSYRLSRAKNSDVFETLVEFLPHAVVIVFFGLAFLKTLGEFFY